MNISIPISLLIILMLYIFGKIIELSPIRNEFIPVSLIIISIIMRIIIYYSTTYVLLNQRFLLHNAIIEGFIFACIPITIRQLQIQWRKLNVYQ